VAQIIGVKDPKWTYKKVVGRESNCGGIPIIQQIFGRQQRNL